MSRDAKGFTLMELLVVLIIVGILATLGMPQYGRTVERSRQAEAISILGALRGAQLRFAAENSGSYATLIGNLDIDVPAGGFFTYDVTNTQADGSNLAEGTRNGQQVTAGNANYMLIINSTGVICCNVGDDCAGAVPQCL